MPLIKRKHLSRNALKIHLTVLSLLVVPALVDGKLESSFHIHLTVSQAKIFASQGPALQRFSHTVMERSTLAAQTSEAP
jgi:hypothetical protein